MKTKQAKEEIDKSIDEDIAVEPKTRARKKASDLNEDDRNKASPEDTKTSKELKKNLTKTKAVVKKRPLGIRKTLRSKKVVVKSKVKNVIKQTVKRGRRRTSRVEIESTQDKETVPLIPASEIKKEPVDDTISTSRSSSPKTAGRRQRLSSDMVMMKSVLGDSPSSLVLGPRTSPYSMRSERSNSPSLFEGKNLRSGKPRKVKNNLLNEVVMKEQKKRRRLLSDSKTTDVAEVTEECKKQKRGRSCSRDGSEISKCSDITESDISLSEPINEPDNKELNKKVDKPKTDLDVDIENSLKISTLGKVPSLNVDSKLADVKSDTEHSAIINDKSKKKLSLTRSTSLDSDNNNTNRLKLDNLNSSDIEDKLLMKTENDTLFEARSSILTSMSKTFNSKEMSKNIRKARRGRKAAAAAKSTTNQAAKNGISSTITNDSGEDKQETLETLSKEIDDLINNLDQNIDGDHEMINDSNIIENTSNQMQTKTVSKFYGLSKPLGDNNSIITPETPIKDKDAVSQVNNESTPSKNDDSENIRLHYEIDSAEKSTDSVKPEISYNHTTVASIDKLMDRLKEFEEFDKRRQRQESESKSSDGKTSLMVTNDVVLIPKSGDIKPLKDIQTVISPEKPIEKENVLSCFENNSAISILKRDQVRKSIDVDLPNSVTLIKRNSISARKESTSSNHSRESDAISIFEKSLGKDVTLTEIRKPVDKSTPTTQVDLHQFATLHPNNPSQSLVGVVLDASQISITPRVVSESKINTNEVQIIKRKSRESLSRKSSESGNEPEEKMATIEKIEKIKSPPLQIKFPPQQIKSPPPPQQIKSPPPPQQTKSSSPPQQNKSPPPPQQNKSPPPPQQIKSPPLPQQIKSPPPPQQNKSPPPPQQIKSLPPPQQIKSPPPPQQIKSPPPPQQIKSPPPPQQIKSPPPPQQIKSPAISMTPTPVAVKSPETSQPMEAEALAPPLENVKTIPEDISLTSEVSKVDSTELTIDSTSSKEEKTDISATAVTENQADVPEKEKLNVTEVPEKVQEEIKEDDAQIENKIESQTESKQSENTEVTKPGKCPGKGNKSARNSTECQPGPSNILQETPESQKRKENVLRTLGLITLKAANEAKEKLKEKERIYGSSYNTMMNNKNKAAKSGSGDYTGTLKTVIKLNRNSGERDKKKYRSSLKITFQKSKNRSGKPTPEVGEPASEDDAFYTIERREGVAVAATDDTEAVPEPEPKETLNLVIPEKASSFSIHPDRLCMDQCFYCGGKFGLFDTPCHIAQMKSSERQKKVLDNEEKLTIDSCLCDACYRHVDRRANCPSYRKRPASTSTVKQLTDAPQLPSPPHNIDGEGGLDRPDRPGEKPPSPPPPPPPPPPPLPPPLEEESEEENAAEAPVLAGGRVATCHTEGCSAVADRSIRRKWLIKMRSSVNKILKLECDYPGLHTIPLCARHHAALAPLLACALCRRRITKHHNVHTLHHDYAELNPLLKETGIPVQFTERPLLCKMCRFYCTLLQRPGYNDKHAKAYRRRLLQIYKIEVPMELEEDTEETMTMQEDSNLGNIKQQKKKMRTKSKQRKSSEPDKPGDSESSERTSETPPEKDTVKEDSYEGRKTAQPLEEDIESLISSNKIPVPGAVKTSSNETSIQSDSSETDAVFDLDTPLLPLDKQTELQYLLQKQNNPAQFLQKPPNLTQKQRNILKVQNMSGIQKAGQQHRINEKNAKRIHKIGQMVAHKEKINRRDFDVEMIEADKSKDGIGIFKNIPLNDECTIETIPSKKPADINTLKNKWQMSESFTQVKKNLSELSKKLPIEKEAKKGVDVKYSNPVKRLETNPSISVRELFPGEEEMNLQCNIEFNNVKGVTPEGWEKCNTTIQYDVETKKLWTELQRPYGNQSSFLRHLILLEKYFRSGDLVLAHNASPNAANYSDSVQSRLRAYDNIVNDAPRRSEPAISLIEFRKKPSMNGKSLLKSNQNSEGEKDHRRFMPPPEMFPKPKPVKASEKKPKTLPPELIAINNPNTQGRKAIQNVLHNIQQLVKGVSASDPTEVAAAPLPAPKVDTPKEKKETPKTDTPKKQNTTSKPWRPTLMPITRENLAKAAREPPKIAVDGRCLPSLVQVISSGKRYHITLQDYNKMCLLRRGKLMQLQDGEAKSKRPSTDAETTVVTEVQPSAMLGNGGTVVQNIAQDKDGQDKTKESAELGSIGTNAATILKNVGLKNITIAPIPPKTATITLQTVPSPIAAVSSPTVSSPSPSLLVPTPMKLPQLAGVSITSEAVLTPNPPLVSSAPMVMPRIPKSLTVIPQTVVAGGPPPQQPPQPQPLARAADGPRP